MPVMNINLFSITLRYGIDCMVVLPENLKKRGETEMSVAVSRRKRRSYGMAVSHTTG